MIVQKQNCQNCRDEKHSKCSNPDTCKCAHYNHSDNLLIGVKLDKSKPVDVKQYNKETKEVKHQIEQEPKAFQNGNWDLVADIIQTNDHFLTLRESKDMWSYDRTEGIYKPYADTIIAESCQKMIGRCTDKSVREIIKTIQRNQTMINAKELFESRHINAQDGILDPKTFEIKPHSSEYYTTTKLPFSLNTKIKNVKLWRHILTIIDPKDINLIMELIWICISWNNPFKKMFVFKGEPNTQKTTLADILVWIIGKENVSREKPSNFLAKGSRFSTSKFIGKRINIASEIGNLTSDMIETMKSLVGAELQNTERKGDNTERYFDSTHFVFLYTTNKLGEIYSNINEASIITRFQFLIFRNQLNERKTNGQWNDKFFKDEEDKKSAIDTVVRLVINYKKSQVFGSTPPTKWSNNLDTKTILDEEMPIEDKYFRDERIIERPGSKLTLDEIKKDFELFVGFKVDPQQMGYILRKHGFKSKRSNNLTRYQGYSFNTDQGQTILETK